MGVTRMKQARACWPSCRAWHLSGCPPSTSGTSVGVPFLPLAPPVGAVSCSATLGPHWCWGSLGRCCCSKRPLSPHPGVLQALRPRAWISSTSLTWGLSILPSEVGPRLHCVPPHPCAEGHLPNPSLTVWRPAFMKVVTVKWGHRGGALIQ